MSPPSGDSVDVGGLRPWHEIAHIHERLADGPLHALPHTPNHHQDSFVAQSTEDGRRIEVDLRLGRDALQGPVMDKGLALDTPDITSGRFAVPGQDGGKLLVGLVHLLSAHSFRRRTQSRGCIRDRLDRPHLHRREASASGLLTSPCAWLSAGFDTSTRGCYCGHRLSHRGSSGFG